MKSYDYDAVVYDSDVYCKDCLPLMILDDDNTMPIFADSEWDYVPVCCECGRKHDYITILS